MLALSYSKYVYVEDSFSKSCLKPTENSRDALFFTPLLTGTRCAERNKFRLTVNDMALASMVMNSNGYSIQSFYKSPMLIEMSHSHS